MNKPKKTYTYQEICNILCDGCRLKIPLNTHLFEDKSYRLYHIIMDKDITCHADDWRIKCKIPPKHRRKGERIKYPEL